MENYLILLIFHLIGDFYLQTTKVARCKNAAKGELCGECQKCKNNIWFNGEYLLMHSVLYIVPFLVLYFVAGWKSVTGAIAILLATHILIDATACYFNKKMKQTVVFIIDQMLHMGVLCIILHIFGFNCDAGRYYEALKIVFLSLALIMPCSIMINKLIQDIYPNSNETGMFDVGSMIGVMERILTVVFACLGNFSAIAIIITIKTWARTNDLKEAEFRNKYLLGTLTSLVLALLIFIIYNEL